MAGCMLVLPGYTLHGAVDALVAGVLAGRLVRRVVLRLFDLQRDAFHGFGIVTRKRGVAVVARTFGHRCVGGVANGTLALRCMVGSQRVLPSLQPLFVGLDPVLPVSLDRCGDCCRLGGDVRGFGNRAVAVGLLCRRPVRGCCVQPLSSVTQLRDVAGTLGGRGRGGHGVSASRLGSAQDGVADSCGCYRRGGCARLRLDVRAFFRSACGQAAVPESQAVGSGVVGF